MRVVRALITLLFLSSLLTHEAFAWENFPEFESLTEQEQSAFDRPSLLGPEYQSSILAYSKPPEWQHYWLSHDIALDTSIGSISAVHFLTDTRAKIHAALLSWMQFRFTYFDEQNFDRHSTHGIFELVFRPPVGLARHFGFSIYGEPSFYKRQNDIGAALLWWPADHHEIRVFNTWVDVTRQKRNDQNNTFVENTLPYARGLVGRYWNDHENFVEYAIRYETKTEWRFPDEQYFYSYWREFASLYISRVMNDAWRLTSRIQLDRKFEARDPLSTSSVVSPASWTTDRLLLNVRGTLHAIGPYRHWDFTWGLDWAHRQWNTQVDTLIYNDWTPHFSLRLPGPWELTYQFTWHRKVGGGIIDHPSDKDDVLNHRLDVSYSFIFASHSELRLLASFDLDAFATADTWQGGNAQFRWYLP